MATSPEKRRQLLSRASTYTALLPHGTRSRRESTTEKKLDRENAAKSRVTMGDQFGVRVKSICQS